MTKKKTKPAKAEKVIVRTDKNSEVTNVINERVIKR